MVTVTPASMARSARPVNSRLSIQSRDCVIATPHGADYGENRREDG
jgi:hypothetical protein